MKSPPCGSLPKKNWVSNSRWMARSIRGLTARRVRWRCGLRQKKLSRSICTPRKALASTAGWRSATWRILRIWRRDDTVYFCGGGMNSFAINAYGEMGICVISQQETFDIRQCRSQTGVGAFSSTRCEHRKRTRVTKCVQCRIQSLCGMCPANGEMENGDRESPVEFLCHVAHLRATAIGVEIPAHGDCEFCAGGSRTRGIAGVGATNSEQGN